MSPRPAESANPNPQRTPASIFILAGVIVAGVIFFLATGVSGGALRAVATIAIDGACAAAIVLSAGGWAYPVVRRVAGARAPRALTVLTAMGLGLWAYSSVLLGVGSLLGGLTAWLWWPVVAVGLLLGLWQAWPTFSRFTPGSRTPGRVLLWMLLVAMAAFWMAGASLPPGTVGGADAYDVLSYHLQVPREHYHAGQIGQLQHNCYSYFPMGGEMLFLLGMILRGGPWDGMYLAKFMHGAFGVLAVAAMLTAHRRDDPDKRRDWYAAGLLASTPVLIELSWLAFVELAQVFYLVLAVLWVRHWLDASVPVEDRPVEDRLGNHGADGKDQADAPEPSPARYALLAGAACGAACATKYLAVGFVAGPVLAVMLASMVVRLRRIRGVLLAGAMAAALMSPWLVRNAALTGNPVFPLATETFGRAHWSAMSQQRWIAGHQPGDHPPVPEPEHLVRVPGPDRLNRFTSNFLMSKRIGPVSVLLGVAAIAVLLAERRRRDAWFALLVAVAGLQLVVWTGWTRGMPTRFLTPIVVPLCLLGGYVLQRVEQFAQMRAQLARSDMDSTSRPSRSPSKGARTVFGFGIGVNILVTVLSFPSNGTDETLQGMPAEALAVAPMLRAGQTPVPDDARFLLVGKADAFYFPPGSVYATAFDANLLAEMMRSGLHGSEALAKLRAMGVTHIWVDWAEIWRLAGTYGYAPIIADELLARYRAGMPPGLKILDEMQLSGAEPIGMGRPATLPTRPTRPDPRWHPFAFPQTWPRWVLYRVPAEPAW